MVQVMTVVSLVLGLSGGGGKLESDFKVKLLGFSD